MRKKIAIIAGYVAVIMLVHTIVRRTSNEQDAAVIVVLMILWVSPAVFYWLRPNKSVRS